MRVVIAGGGIGGLVLALSLGARGVRATLVEREAVWGEAGAGVQLGPNAVRVLDALGLGDPLRGAAFAPAAADVFSSRGARRLHLPLGEAAQARWGAPYLQIHRADLQRLLLAAVATRDAAALKTGVAVEAAGLDGTVHLSSGETLQADVVVGADGLWSRVRDAVAGPVAPRFSGQVAWRALIPAAALARETAMETAAVWVGAGRHLVAYPVQSGAAVNLVAVIEGARSSPSWREPADPQALAMMFERWAPPARALTSAPAANGLPVWRWPLFDRPGPHAWTRGRIALLGDAAHPILPFLAQGAAMAIEDAVTLAAALAGAVDITCALSAYAVARRDRVARVHAASRSNARLFHLPEPLSAAAFAAARRLDAWDASAGMARFDWLYGWRSPGA